MNEQLGELIRLISSGCMTEAEIQRIADEAAQAYADPAAFLAANPDVNYDDSFPIPLGEWVVVGSLPDTVLFQADDYEQLFAQVVARCEPAGEPARPERRVRSQTQATGENRTTESAEPYPGPARQPLPGERRLRAGGFQRTAG